MEKEELIQEVVSLKYGLKNTEEKMNDLSKNTTEEIAMIKKKLEENTQFSMDLKLLNKTVQDLAVVVGDLKSQSLSMQERLNEYNSASTKEKASKWDKIVDKLLTVIVGAIAGYVISHMGF